MEDEKEIRKEISSAVQNVEDKRAIYAVIRNEDGEYEGLSVIETKEDMEAVGEFITQCMLESKTFANAVLEAFDSIAKEKANMEETAPDFHKMGALPIFVNNNYKS